MKTLMTSLLLAGTALMAAQTGNTPAPASASTTAPAKVKKHHHKKKSADPAGAATKPVPASATPAK